MRISGIRPFLISSVLIVLVVIGGIFWWQHRKPAGDSTLVDHAIEAKDIQSFSMGGDVISVDHKNSQFDFKTGWVENGEFKYTTRTIMIIQQTKILSVTKDGTLTVAQKNPIDYIQVGDKVTVYGVGNPIITATLLADKIEVKR